MLEPRRAALETCAFCPKLCRSACPVSNAEPRETITPWGKMSMAYFTAQGDVPTTPSYAEPAWACTGCYGCRESCDHRNDVTGTLLDARAALVREGVAPEGAKRAIARFADHQARTREKATALAGDLGASPGARVGLLVGCGYLHRAESEARDAVRVARALTGEDVAIVEACCGAPLRMAGDDEGFARAAADMDAKLSRFERTLVVDAGCAETLRLHAAPALARDERRRDAGTAGDASRRAELLVELAARELTRLGTLGPHPVRWHDPCRLGRGLGVYDAPRAVLTRILGHAPAEFATHRERATCAGGGGLLPLTMPENARAIAEGRVGEHARGGGGHVVTACASSLRTLRRAAGGQFAVDDIVTWMARSLG